MERSPCLVEDTVTLMLNMPLLCSDLREAVTRLRSAEVNAVSGVLKLYFRELPEPLIPTEMFQRLARTLGKMKQAKTGFIFLRSKQLLTLGFTFFQVENYCLTIFP